MRGDGGAFGESALAVVRWFVAVMVFGLCLCVPSGSAVARERSVTAVLQGLERDYHVKPKRVPGFWLAKLVVRVAHPKGVSKMDLALFEDENLQELIRVPDLQTRVHTMLGAGWKRFVELDSSKKGERVLMFARPKGRRLELIVFSAEKKEAVVLFARVNPRSVQKMLEDPPHF